MKIKKALKLSPCKLAYRISNTDQILIVTIDEQLLFVNKYSIIRSDEKAKTESVDWLPVY